MPKPFSFTYLLMLTCAVFLAPKTALAYKVIPPENPEKCKPGTALAWYGENVVCVPAGGVVLSDACTSQVNGQIPTSGYGASSTGDLPAWAKTNPQAAQEYVTSLARGLVYYPELVYDENGPPYIVSTGKLDCWVPPPPPPQQTSGDGIP